MLLAPAELSERLGLKKYPRSWRGRCPSCGYNAFSVRAFKEGRASMYCSNGCTREVLADAASRIAGHAWEPPPAPDQADAEAIRERKRAAALRLWHRARPAPGTLADRYLTLRGLPKVADSSSLGFAETVSHPEGGCLPAMIAAVTDVSNTIIAAHRTYLDWGTGAKANVTPAKASLGSFWGGAIRLQDAAEQIVIAEGIETAASAGLLLNLPAWAAVSAGNLAKGLVLPPRARHVIIAADRDPVGQEAAWTAAGRWRAEGRTVQVALPDKPDSDFNDIICARAADKGTAGG